MKYLDLIQENDVEERKLIMCYTLVLDQERSMFLIEEQKKQEALEKARKEREAEQKLPAHIPHRG